MRPLVEPLVRVWWSRCIGDARPAAHALLMSAASRLLGRPVNELSVSHEPGGRPVLVGPDLSALSPATRNLATSAMAEPGLHVSVSHCRAGVVAAALSVAGPVGVDVETVRPLPWEQMAGRWFSADEQAWLRDVPVDEQVRAFLRLWTYKEAVGKAYGSGLRGGGLRRTGGRGSAGAPRDGTWTLTPMLGSTADDPPDDPAMVAAVAYAASDVVLAVACATAAASGSTVAVEYVDGR